MISLNLLFKLFVIFRIKSLSLLKLHTYTFFYCVKYLYLQYSFNEVLTNIQYFRMRHAGRDTNALQDYVCFNLLTHCIFDMKNRYASRFASNISCQVLKIQIYYLNNIWREKEKKIRNKRLLNPINKRPLDVKSTECNESFICMLGLTNL